MRGGRHPGQRDAARLRDDARSQWLRSRPAGTRTQLRGAGDEHVVALLRGLLRG